MTNNDTSPPLGQDISERTAALWAGTGLLMMAVLAPIAYFGLLPALLVSGNATVTAQNLLANPGNLNLAVALLLIAAILDVVVGWSLYLVFQRVNRGLALLAALFRVAYAAIFVVALNSLAAAPAMAAVSAEQALAMTKSFYSTWNLGLALFGVHLVVLSLLVWSKTRVISGLVLLAGLGYLLDSFGKLLWPDFGVALASYTFLGEVVLIVWLFWKGGRQAAK